MTQRNLQNRKGLTVLENEPVAAGGDVGIGRDAGTAGKGPKIAPCKSNASQKIQYSLG